MNELDRLRAFVKDLTKTRVCITCRKALPIFRSGKYCRACLKQKNSKRTKARAAKRATTGSAE